MLRIAWSIDRPAMRHFGGPPRSPRRRAASYAAARPVVPAHARAQHDDPPPARPARLGDVREHTALRDPLPPVPLTAGLQKELPPRDTRGPFHHVLRTVDRDAALLVQPHPPGLVPDAGHPDDEDDDFDHGHSPGAASCFVKVALGAAFFKAFLVRPRRGLPCAANEAFLVRALRTWSAASLNAKYRSLN